jgi:metal-responsive CopG/Arc/MetJ family transcriptional regulator
VTLPKELLAQVGAALGEGETRSTFIRDALVWYLDRLRREGRAAKKRRRARK